jgi:signal transduction histidine kinase
MGKVTIVEDYGGNLPLVNIDRNLIAQVIINLCTNAIAAMPNGGTLTVTTGQQNQEVYVRFTDTGTGIEPNVIERIFDPFFTTKSNSGGTGLGLSVTRGIISQHRGRIEVESSLGQGTTFTVWLPPATAIQEEEIGARGRNR